MTGDFGRAFRAAAIAHTDVEPAGCITTTVLLPPAAASSDAARVARCPPPRKPDLGRAVLRKHVYMAKVCLTPDGPFTLRDDFFAWRHRHCALPVAFPTALLIATMLGGGRGLKGLSSVGCAALRRCFASAPALGSLLLFAAYCFGHHPPDHWRAVQITVSADTYSVSLQRRNRQFPRHCGLLRLLPCC